MVVQKEQVALMLHVVAAAIIKDGFILSARRLPGGMHGGLWEFPGGKVEEGEDEATALKRELKEELGIEARIGRKLIEVPWEYPHRKILLDVYLAEITEGEPRCIGCSEVRWVTLNELGGLEMPEADRPVVSELLRVLRDAGW